MPCSAGKREVEESGSRGKGFCGEKKEEAPRTFLTGKVLLRVGLRKRVCKRE